MKKALIVGINNYPKKWKLTACRNDATVVHELLSRHGDKNSSQNFDAKLVVSIEKKDELFEQVLDLFATKCDTALFYFSGHGADNEFDYHLVTPDFKGLDIGMPMNQLLSLVNKSPAKNKIVILDCCHAAGMGVTKPTSGMTVSLLPGVTILASSRANEPSIEKRNGHGVFTNLLIEALKGGAADLNGNITPGGIYAYIDKAMGPVKQRPVFKTNISEFVSLRKVKPQVEQNILQNITDLFPDPAKKFALNPSFEFTNHPKVKPLQLQPHAVDDNVAKFKQLQKLQSIGLVVPVGADHMYFAAMESKACKLTPLGQHYWKLINDSKKGGTIS
jgi:Caspase domain